MSGVETTNKNINMDCATLASYVEHWEINMKTAILILEHELEWTKAHRGQCPHGDSYFSGWCGAIRANISILQMAENASNKPLKCESKNDST